MLNENPQQKIKKFKSLRFLAGLIYFFGGLIIIAGISAAFVVEHLSQSIIFASSGILSGLFFIFLAEIANILLAIEENTRK